MKVELEKHLLSALVEHARAQASNQRGHDGFLRHIQLLDGNTYVFQVSRDCPGYLQIYYQPWVDQHALLILSHAPDGENKPCPLFLHQGPWCDEIHAFAKKTANDLAVKQQRIVAEYAKDWEKRHVNPSP